MTCCPIDYSTEEHARALRLARSAGIGFIIAASLFVGGLLTSIGHPPEPNQCEQGPAQNCCVQIVSPTTLESCSGASPKQSPR
jgi:hypothetical protein